MENELIEKLVSLGAEKLEHHLHYLSNRDCEMAQYFKGSFQALKEAAQVLFEIDHVEFRGRCEERRHKRPELWLNSEYWDCECDDKYIQPNSREQCPICGAMRDEMPDSRQNEVDEGTHFADAPL